MPVYGGSHPNASHAGTTPGGPPVDGTSL